MTRTGVVLAIVLTACSGAQTTTTTLASTSTTTPSQQIVDGGLVPVDPPTLIPYENASPVVTGVWHEGTVSPARSHSAVVSGQAQGEPVTSVIDLNNLVSVAEGTFNAAGLVVTDDGSAYFFDNGRLTRLDDSGAFELEAPATQPELTGSLHMFENGQLGYLASDVPGGEAKLALVDGGEVWEHPTSISSDETHQPGVDWTADAAHVVDAFSNSVERVPLSGDGIDVFEFETPFDIEQDLVRREVVVVGTNLFVATSTSTDTGRVTSRDLVFIDLSDGSHQVVDVVVSDLALSPTLDILAAFGSVPLEDGSLSQSPVYLIDTATGEPLVGFEGRSGEIQDVQFSADGSEMYVVSRTDNQTNIDVVDIATRSLAGNVTFTGISLVGEAGLMAFHSSPR